MKNKRNNLFKKKKQKKLLTVAETKLQVASGRKLFSGICGTEPLIVFIGRNMDSFPSCDKNVPSTER